MIIGLCFLNTWVDAARRTGESTWCSGSSGRPSRLKCSRPTASRRLWRSYRKTQTTHLFLATSTAPRCPIAAFSLSLVFAYCRERQIFASLALRASGDNASCVIYMRLLRLESGWSFCRPACLVIWRATCQLQHTHELISADKAVVLLITSATITCTCTARCHGVITRVVQVSSGTVDPQRGHRRQTLDVRPVFDTGTVDAQLAAKPDTYRSGSTKTSVLFAFRKCCFMSTSKSRNSDFIRVTTLRSSGKRTTVRSCNAASAEYANRRGHLGLAGPVD